MIEATFFPLYVIAMCVTTVYCKPLGEVMLALLFVIVGTWVLI